MANINLTNAKNAKYDEFYTQFHDIDKEISAYLEYNPAFLGEKRFYVPAMILTKAIFSNTLHLILAY